MKICVPLQAKTQKEAKAMFRVIAGKADFAEIWLDQIADLDLPDLLVKKPLPVVCVCKKPVENGVFKGTYSQMAKLLLSAAHAGADYLDVPFAMPALIYSDFRREMNKKFVHSVFTKKPRLIISYHDFKKTPSEAELLKKVAAMRKRGADVVKIATLAHGFDDTVRMITLAKQLQEMKIPHILIAMGQKGMLSRVLTPMLGGEMMFAPLDTKKASAPGQLTVAELRKQWANLI